MKLKNILFCTILILNIISCGVYSFTGGDTGSAKTIQINYFPNNATLVEPGLSQQFTQELQDLFLRQTNLNLVKANGDLFFEGEITNYRVTPMTATAEQTAAQSRLTIVINIRFYNKLDANKDFEKRFTHFSDFSADEQLTGTVLEGALEEIFERIIQDVFNASVANW
ncbi:LptE family protein [Flavicella sp.]|uniref:LptE family protein n=1 Tax=Flavicella sp. TaxID=2957742 RepID=UPI003017B81C